jgi:hypothetical protein
MSRALGIRNPTAREAMGRRVLAGSTVGELASQGRSRGVPVGATTSHVFAPQFALPSQVPRRSLAELQPERKLMLAVLESVLLTLSKLREDREAYDYQQAASWVRSDDTRWPFSCLNICAALGFAPDTVRRVVLAEGFAMVGDGLRLRMVVDGRVGTGGAAA